MVTVMIYYFTLLMVLRCIFPTLGIDVEVVSVKQGKLIGTHEVSTNGRKYFAFLGIPYALPPTGKYRFRDPVPYPPWIGVYEATEKPNICLQYDLMLKIQTGSEDCLYINIFTPKLPREHPSQSKLSENLLKTIVYIHGGAFTSSTGYEYGPKHLLDQDLVFVNFNYRVGSLGFLSTEDENIPGNYGLKDQVLAMKWVKENIAAFGGDPETITLAGMSAGGVSVHYHLLSPLSKGLFQFAISMSGTALVPWAQADNSKEKAYMIGKDLRCPTDHSRKLLECLQTRSAEDIVGLTTNFLPWLDTLPFTPFGPVAEPYGPNPFISKSPIDVIKEGPVSDVPWLVSFAKDEGLYPGVVIICNEENFEDAIDDWENKAPYILDYLYTCPNENMSLVNEKVWDKYMNTNKNLHMSQMINMITDRLYVANIVQAAVLHSVKMSSPVYAYEFSYRGKNSLTDVFCSSKENYGVSHADDLGYVTNVEFLNPNETVSDIRMKDILTEMWFTFAGSGKAEIGENLDSWPAIRDDLPFFTYVKILSPDKIEVVKELNVGNITFWSHLGLKENISR